MGITGQNNHGQSDIPCPAKFPYSDDVPVEVIGLAAADDAIPDMDALNYPNRQNGPPIEVDDVPEELDAYHIINRHISRHPGMGYFHSGRKWVVELDLTKSISNIRYSAGVPDLRNDIYIVERQSPRLPFRLRVDIVSDYPGKGNLFMEISIPMFIDPIILGTVFGRCMDIGDEVKVFVRIEIGENPENPRVRLADYLLVPAERPQIAPWCDSSKWEVRNVSLAEIQFPEDSLWY